MDFFTCDSNQTFCEDIPLEDLAKEFGTPLYVYSNETLSRHCHRFLAAFEGVSALACFAVKANSNGSLLREIFGHGFGADVVSGGELTRSLRAGALPVKIVFSGVGKTRSEIELGLHSQIKAFNVESLFELEGIIQTCKDLRLNGTVSLRLNPDIGAPTHPKINTGHGESKFGIELRQLPELVDLINRSSDIRLAGLSCHIGSQIVDLTPLTRAATFLASTAMKLATEHHQTLEFLNVGGGLGIRYSTENPPELEDYARALIDATSASGLQLLVEPGRLIVGNTGVLLTRILGVKKSASKTFLIVDAAMNDLLRPALYDSYHDIVPVCGLDRPRGHTFEVVGPVCETGDVLGVKRDLPSLQAGELLYLRSAGAYGMSMSSQYNSRPRAAEVLVKGSHVRLVRRRETIQDLLRCELEV